MHHPEVGDLDLAYEALELPADPGLTMLVHGAEPGSASADALRLLASLHAVPQEPAHEALDSRQD